MFLSRFAFLYLLATSFPSSLAATNAGQVLLPKPNGAFQVGMGAMELIDKSRLQIFALTVEPRKVTVSLFYPVKSHSSTKPVKHMPPYTAAFEDGSQETVNGLVSPNGTFEKLALRLTGECPQPYAISDFPVVLFSPAQGTTRLFYSVIAQTIASSGYIVVTIDAPHDVDIVEYLDSTVTLVNTTVINNASLADTDIAVATRALDASFVLDQLRNVSVVSNLISGFSKALNVNKVAMFGHSIGGAATAAAMLKDSRIAGGVAMDGALFGPVVQKGLDRPFMLMAQTNHTRTDKNVQTTQTTHGSAFGKICTSGSSISCLQIPSTTPSPTFPLFWRLLESFPMRQQPVNCR